MHVFGPKQPRNRKTPGTGFFLEVVKQGFGFGLNAAVAAELRPKQVFAAKSLFQKYSTPSVGLSISRISIKKYSRFIFNLHQSVITHLVRERLLLNTKAYKYI